MRVQMRKVTQMKEETRVPSILIPYAGPCTDAGVQDIAIYLRPESNGVKAERTILSVIHKNPAYKKALQFVYLSNIPGDFIVANRVIEEHYAVKILFAREGKRAFTDSMRGRFEEFFSCPFDQAEILSAFEALGQLRKTPEELHEIWVPQGQYTEIHGQSIKKTGGVFIVNYDIPALLHKNTAGTDVFSMILRSYLPYSEFHGLIKTITAALKEEGIITNPLLYSHVFHYSKGPFEQILDGIGYIYTRGDEHIDLTELSFFAYLMTRGCERDAILAAIRQPIMPFEAGQGRTQEHNLFVYTFEDSFEEAFDKFQSRIIP